MDASTQANMLNNAPKSMATPSGEMPTLAASKCSGLVESVSLPDSPRKPSTSEYEHSMKKAPDKMAHCNTTRGMVRNGSLASAPKVVALSKPTKLNMESTNAGPSAGINAPFSLSWSRSRCSPKWTSTRANRMRMRLTEAVSPLIVSSQKVAARYGG